MGTISGIADAHLVPCVATGFNRQFWAEGPNEKWVGDITYLRTREGWLYLAAVLDIYSRKVVGWAMDGGDKHMEQELVASALRMATTHRRPGGGVLHHSDRGSQYAAQDYQQLLGAHKMQVSMSRKGDCYDNAVMEVMESFWATLKAECATGVYKSRAEARQSIFEYIEVWYNRQRRHSSLGYASPETFEKIHFESDHESSKSVLFTFW
jgi:putative transposase